MRARKYSVRTRKRYLAILEDYLDYSGKPLAETVAQDLTRYLSHLERSRGASASTLNQTISALKFVLEKV
jgi:site-specific recombinase XerD